VRNEIERDTEGSAKTDREKQENSDRWRELVNAEGAIYKGMRPEKEADKQGRKEIQREGREDSTKG
jgi:hypothetical protein